MATVLVIGTFDTKGSDMAFHPGGLDVRRHGVVRKLVGDMNGRITHDREDATGWTHFRLHLPVAPQGAVAIMAGERA